MRRLTLVVVAWLVALGCAAPLPAQSSSSPTTPAPAPAAAPPADVFTVPAGERLILELQDSLNTRNSRKGDEVHFVTVNETLVGYQVVIPRGSSVRATLIKVKRPGRAGRGGQMQLRFEEIILPDGTTLPLPATLVRAGFFDVKKDRAGASVRSEGGGGGAGRNAATVAVNAGQGALVGVLLGGGQGAAVGGAVGAGIGIIGILMQRGPHLDLPPGTLFEVELNGALPIPEASVARFNPAPPQLATAAPPDAQPPATPDTSATYNFPGDAQSPQAEEPVPDFSQNTTDADGSNRDTTTPPLGTPAPPPPATAEPPLPPPLDPTLGDPNAFKLKVDVRVVLVEAFVRDRSGRSLDNLAREDFRLFEGGAEQQIRHFSRDELPLAVALVVDRSGSVAPYMPELRRAAYQTLSQLKPGDQVCLFTFAADVDRLEDLTTDRQLIAERIARIRAAGGTNITDAIFAASQYLALAAPDRRRAVILISDNVGTVPGFSSQSGATRMALDAEVVVYSVKTPGENSQRRFFGIPVPGPGRVNVGRIAEETGGELFDVRRVGSLAAALAAVVTRLRTRYTLGYQPTNKARDGGFRKIEVRLVDRRGRPGSDYTVHARTGYYAPTGQVAAQQNRP